MKSDDLEMTLLIRVCLVFIFELPQQWHDNRVFFVNFVCGIVDMFCDCVDCVSDPVNRFDQFETVFERLGGIWSADQKREFN